MKKTKKQQNHNQYWQNTDGFPGRFETFLPQTFSGKAA